MFWNWISYQARQRPRAIAAELAERVIDYATFAADITRARDELRAALPASARLVGVSVNHGYLHWVVTLALARLEIASVSVLGDQAVALARADAIVADKAGFAGAPAIPVSPQWMGNQVTPEALAARDPDDDFDLRLVLSSGTTGEPKRVMLSATVMTERCRLVDDCYVMNAATRSHSQMSVDTIGGFTIPISTWMGGGAVVLSNNPFFDDRIPPAAKPNLCMISTGDLGAFVRRAEGARQVFADTRFMVAGSAPPKGLMALARERLSPTIWMIYGATEAGLVTMETRQDPRVPERSIGFAVPTVEVQIVDDADQILPPRSQGNIRIRSPLLGRGYLDNPEATARHFRDGWFYPGDLGMSAADGMLVITGRTSEMFNFGGMKIAPIRIEDVAQECRGVREAAVCAMRDPDGEIAALGVVTSPDYDKAELERLLAENFRGARFAIAQLASIPRNNMGKIGRRELAEAILARTAATQS